MGRLSRIYQGIEVVNLRQLDALNGPIVELNRILTKTENEISTLNAVLKQQSANIQDAQFLLANKTVSAMVQKLNGYAEDVFEAQRAVEQLFYNIMGFEPTGAYKTNFANYRRIDFTYQIPNIDPTKVILTKSAYIAAYQGMDNFKSEIEKLARRLMSITTDGWRDAQSSCFQGFCGNIAGDLIKYLEILVQYKNYLGGRINNWP